MKRLNQLLGAIFAISLSISTAFAVGTSNPPTGGSGGAATPGGSNGQIQYNNNGAFGGESAVPVASGGSGQVPGIVFNSAAAASANTTAINAALAAGGHVKLDCAPSGQVVYTSGSLVVGSNTDFEVKQGCTVRQASGTNNALLVNAAYTHSWTTVYDNSGTITNGPLNVFQQPNAWATSTAYVKGNEVTANGGYYWESAATCTSASSGTGPTGTGTGIADGTCTWNYITAATPTSVTTPYPPTARSTYYAIVHYPSHGLSVGNFLFLVPQPDNGNAWTGTGAAGALGGPADSAYFGVFYVAAINDSNYVTVELRRQPSAVFTGIPVNMKLADDNIKIEGGGTFDYNYAQNPGGATLLNDMNFILSGIHNLIMYNVNGINSYKYFIDAAGLYQADIGHVQGGPGWVQDGGVNGDQIHIYGPASDIYVHDVNGSGFDDTLVFQTCENLTPSNGTPALTANGEIYKATARNISGNGGVEVGLYESQPAGLLRMQDITLDNVEPYSEKSGFATVLIGGTGIFNDVVIENSTMKDTGSPFLKISPNTNGSGSGITMDSLTLLNDWATEPGSTGLVNFISTASNAPVSVGQLTISNSTYTSAAGAVLSATNTSSATMSIGNVSINNLNANLTGGSVINESGLVIGHATVDNSTINAPENFQLLNITASNSDFALTHSKVVMTAGSGGVVNVASGLTGVRVLVDGNNIAGSYDTINAGSPADYTISNNKIANQYVFYDGTSTLAGSIIRFNSNSLAGNTTGQSYVTYGAGGTAPNQITIYSDGHNTLSGSASWIYARGVSPTTNIFYGWDIPCNVAQAARVTGEYCFNTNTAPGSGTLTTSGLVTDQGTTAPSWFLLSNPSGQSY